MYIITVTGSSWSQALKRAEAEQEVGREAPGQGPGCCPPSTSCPGTQPAATCAVQLHRPVLLSLSLSPPRGLDSALPTDLMWLLVFSVSSSVLPMGAFPGPIRNDVSSCPGVPGVVCPQLQWEYLGRCLAGEGSGWEWLRVILSLGGPHREWALQPESLSPAVPWGRGTWQHHCACLCLRILLCKAGSTPFQLPRPPL